MKPRKMTCSTATLREGQKVYPVFSLGDGMWVVEDALGNEHYVTEGDMK